MAIYHRLSDEQVEILGTAPDNAIRVRYPDGREGQTVLRWLYADGGMAEIQRAVVTVQHADSQR